MDIDKREYIASKLGYKSIEDAFSLDPNRIFCNKCFENTTSESAGNTFLGNFLWGQFLLVAEIFANYVIHG